MPAINHDGGAAGKRGGDPEAPRDAPPRTILHVDLDAFYAAVEMREQPAIAGKPVVVGADPMGGRGRGVVAAASYAARQFGIRSAMPISQAYRRCPTAIFLRPRMELYARESRRFLEILARYTDLIEPISIDEAFLDVTASRALYGDGTTIARAIKAAIQSEQRLTASIGVAPTKFVAKIASEIDKPDGLVVVPPGGVDAFLRPLPVERLWGAGSKAVARLHRLGAHTIGDLAAIGDARVVAAFGESLGQHFLDLARGIDPRAVTPDHERKSIGRESTFGEDVADRAVVERRLFELVEEVAQRMRRAGVVGRVVTVKFRTAEFVTVTRRETLPAAADTVEALWPVARTLLRRADDHAHAVRLVGVSLSSFSAAGQLSLFDTPLRQKQARLARAIDAVTKRFGARAIRHGGG